MNVQIPPPAGGDDATPRTRRPRRTPKGRQVDPRHSPKCARSSANASAAAIS